MEFLLILLVIFVVIALIPYAVAFHTRSEGNDREFRELFYRESGWRGYRIVSTVGCFYPISFVSKLPDTFEGWMFILVFCGICYFVHAQLYIGANILNLRRTGTLGVLVAALIALQVLNKLGYIGVYATSLVMGISSLFWGWYICFVRSRMVAIKLGIKTGRFA